MRKDKQNKKTSPIACFVFTLLVLAIYIVYFTILLSQNSFLDSFAFYFVFSPGVILMLIVSLIVSAINVHQQHHALSYISLYVDIAMIISLLFGLKF